MSAITIVALPEDDEAVWDLSSEKKPHLTLLHMNGPLSDLEGTLQFIQHAASTSLSKFGLSVDHRGTLGPDDADVLFFSQEFGVGNLRNFRAQLLKNDDIAKAYIQTDQFPGWIPHLTMGYPNAPAKEVPEDQKWSLHWINFDRIAVWTSDFEGPEFRLESHDMAPITEASWSDEHGVYIMHYGRRGMKWGVRRPIGSDGLVKGSTPGSATGQEHRSDRATAALAKIKGGADHKKMVENLDKKVEDLSTADIKEITRRIKAVNEFKATTDAEKAAKASLAKKLVTFALTSVKTGVQKKADSYIQELVGDSLTKVLPKTDTQKAKDAKTQREADAAAAKKAREGGDDAKSRDQAVRNLADTILNVDGAYNITTLNKKGG